jgi:hypothetical protein
MLFKEIIDVYCENHETKVNSVVHKILCANSSVGTATGYLLDCRGSIPDRSENLSLLCRVRTGSGAYPISYPMGTEAFFPGGKAAGA